MTLPAIRDARNAIHAALTAILVVVGGVLLIPTETFPGSRSYAVMAALMSEPHWGALFVGVGALGGLGMAASPLWRIASVIVLATMHGVFAACLLAANPVSTGSGTYAIIAALGYYLAWRRVHEDI